MVSALLVICGLSLPPAPVEIHVEHLEVNRFLFERMPGMGPPYIVQLVSLDSQGRYLACSILRSYPEGNKSPLIVEYYGQLYKIHFKRLTRTFSVDDVFDDPPCGNLLK